MKETKTIIDYFQNTVKNFSKKLAVVSTDWQCTYFQLEKLSNLNAQKITEKIKKVQTPILVFCDSPKIITISLISTLKSGNIYVPVSPKTPIERIKEIIKECKVGAYISQYEHQEFDIPYIKIEDNDLNTDVEFYYNGNAQDIAYIIYTSGTTGKSKGVIIQNKGLLNTILQRNSILNLNYNSNSILLMGHTFDGFLTSFFCPLVLGATLYFPNNIFDIKNLEFFFNSYNINNFLCTPTMFRTLLNYNIDLLKNINLVSLAGEAIDKQLIKKAYDFYPNLQIANEYGPTENSICTSIKTDIRHQNIISAGKTIKNVEANIFQNQILCKPNEVGELYLSGVGVSLGYVNDEELTKSKFIKTKGKLWYKTGDLAYINSDNEIVIVGREDSQIKINGFRVDLLEIQNEILEYENIDNCVVVYDDKLGLSAFYSSKIIINKQELISFLKNKLNDYMLPNNFFQISSIPLLDSGKIDLVNLKKCEIIENEKNLSNQTSKNLSIKICEIFKEVLKVEKVDEMDSFFSLGGNSLNSVLIIEKLNNLFNIKLDYDILRFNSTPKSLALNLISSKNLKDEISKIKPFNKFWFVDCYFTSILAIFEKESRPIAPFIRSFIIKSVELNNSYQLLYENKKQLQDIFADFAMKFDAGILENDFQNKILPFVKNSKPVMLHVDCYYLPYCKEKYKKEHFEHVIALINYDEISQTFDVIDQESLQSVSFCYHKLSLKDAEKSAYAEIVNRKTFDNVDFVAIYPSNNINYNEKVLTLDNTQFYFVIEQTILYLQKNEKANLLLVLQRLINYIEVEKEVFKYQQNTEAILDFNKKEAKLKRFLMNCIIEKNDIINKNNFEKLLNEWLAGKKNEN